MTATTTDKPDTRSLRHKDAMCDRARGRAYRLPTLPFRPLSPVASPLGAHRCYIRLFAADLGRLKLNLRHRRYPRDSLDRARPVVELSLRPDRIGAAHLLCVFQCQSSVWFRQNASDRRTDSACRASSGRVSVSSHQYVSSFLQVACAHSTPVVLAIDGLPVWPLGLAQSLSGGGALAVEFGRVLGGRVVRVLGARWSSPLPAVAVDLQHSLGVCHVVSSQLPGPDEPAPPEQRRKPGTANPAAGRCGSEMVLTLCWPFVKGTACESPPRRPRILW